MLKITVGYGSAFFSLVLFGFFSFLKSGLYLKKSSILFNEEYFNYLICFVFSVNTHFEERELQSALKEIRSFLYGDVCDVYVEYIKPNIRVSKNTLKY